MMQTMCQWLMCNRAMDKPFVFNMFSGIFKELPVTRWDNISKIFNLLLRNFAKSFSRQYILYMGTHGSRALKRPIFQFYPPAYQAEPKVSRTICH